MRLHVLAFSSSLPPQGVEGRGQQRLQLCVPPHPRAPPQLLGHGGGRRGLGGVVGDLLQVRAELDQPHVPRVELLLLEPVQGLLHAVPRLLRLPHLLEDDAVVALIVQVLRVVAVVERPRDAQATLGHALRLLQLAHVAEHDGEVVQGLRRDGVLGAQHLLADAQRLLVQLLRLRVVALVAQQPREIVEQRGEVGVLLAVDLAVDVYSRLEVRLGLVQQIHRLQHQAQVVVRRRCARVVHAKHLLPDV
mmetsp:Transcript_7714/g.15728  ORF Transcript_7714/g.15728 Transcript_7714/m.15728 type:complete len:248 (-) Transcript_7714:994-1737(-)